MCSLTPLPRYLWRRHGARNGGNPFWPQSLRRHRCRQPSNCRARGTLRLFPPQPSLPLGEATSACCRIVGNAASATCWTTSWYCGHAVCDGSDWRFFKPRFSRAHRNLIPRPAVSLGYRLRVPDGTALEALGPRVARPVKSVSPIVSPKSY